MNLLNISEKTYQNFNNDKIAPINQLEKNKYLLRVILWANICI